MGINEFENKKTNINSFQELPVGFFDSGVGGLSVLSKFKKALPNENIMYFGDLANLPYGNKTKEQLIGFAKKILNFYQSQNVKAVIIACNTSSAQAYDSIKNDYDFKIYPIIQSCAKVIAESGVKRVGIFATEATVRAGKYTEELIKYNPDLQIKEIPNKTWVPIVEGVCQDANKMILNIESEIKEMMDFKPDKIILGCTHYPYLMKEFEKYAPKEIFVDPAEIFTEFIKSDLDLNPSKKNGYEKFYVSANPKEFVTNSRIFYNIETLPTVVKL